MNGFELEVFEQTAAYAQLRLRDADGGVRSRGLDRAAIEDLIGVVEQSYAQESTAQRVFGSAQLSALGERLFAFLDGDERWLSDALADPRGMVLRISAEQRLRHLPWELLALDGAFLAVSEQTPVLAVRAASPVATLGQTIDPGNRPLRVLFMATSPEGVEPVLDYEAEEAGILHATADTGTELVVEESGTLDGLRFTAESYGAGYFDVLHISGHATVDDGKPAFLVENEFGAPVLAGVDDLTRAMAGRWPRLVFVSGCLTGNAPGGGTIPSMSESLVKAGAAMVLGWALPVGDTSASLFAAKLYQALAAGQTLDRAVVSARHALYAAHSRNWHLARAYADASPLTPMVTPRNTRGRARLRVRPAGEIEAFLDPQTRLSRVASRAEFVGRRRAIQRCLRILTAPLNTTGAAEALLLHGMGGLGKSTLASRLLERMPTYQRVVSYGRVDETILREHIAKIEYASVDDQIEATRVLAEERADLAARLRYLFTGPLAEIDCLFVFDDFEDGNLDKRDSGHVLTPAMAAILPALLSAIRDTNSPSRVLITSRYRFPNPTGTNIRTEALETFNTIEQTKKIANLPHLRPDATATPAAVRQRAIEAAAGNPRLLDWLDKIVIDPGVDVDALIAAIENEADRFRETILAEKLLTAQPEPLQHMLAALNVVELPVPAATVHAMHTHADCAAHIRRAGELGLLEEGTDPATGEPRYFVSNVLRPLLRPLLGDDGYRDACAAAARSLNGLWITGRTEPENTDGTGLTR